MNSDLRQWYTNTHEFSSLLPLGGYVLHEAGLYSRTDMVMSISPLFLNWGNMMASANQRLPLSAFNELMHFG